MKNWITSTLLILILASCGKIEQPEFRSIDDFKVKKFGLQESTIGFDVRYFNPNDFTLNVKEAEADIYIDSVYVGKFVQDNSVAVGEKKEFSIPLTGNISMMQALKLNLTDVSNRQVHIKADGSVKVGKAGVFVSKPFKYEGKHKVDIKL
jgi:LEA14-like dessication related protein